VVHVADYDVDLTGTGTDGVAQGRQWQVDSVLPEGGLALPNVTSIAGHYTRQTWSLYICGAFRCRI
jgi:hypothetical protein